MISTTGMVGGVREAWIPWKPELNTSQSVDEQCRYLVAMVTGRVLLEMLFARDEEKRKTVLDFIDQYIKYGQVR